MNAVEEFDNLVNNLFIRPHHNNKKAAHIDELMNDVLAFAKSLNKDRELIRKMKLDTHKEILTVIDETISSI